MCNVLRSHKIRSHQTRQFTWHVLTLLEPLLAEHELRALIVFRMAEYAGTGPTFFALRRRSHITWLARFINPRRD